MPAEMAVLLLCWLSPQGAAGEAEAGAAGADPTAAPAAPLRGNPLPQDQQPPQAGWVHNPAPGWGAWQGDRGLFPCPLPLGKSKSIFGSRMPNSLDSWYGLSHGLGGMGSADKGAAPCPLGRASLQGEAENFSWLFCCRQAVVLPPVPQPQGAALWGRGGRGAVSPHREPDREK